MIPDDPVLALQARLQDRFIDLYVMYAMQAILHDGMRPEGARDPFGVEQTRKRLCSGLLAPGPGPALSRRVPRLAFANDPPATSMVAARLKKEGSMAIPEIESTGRAYGYQPGTPDPVRTRVTAGTPGGELLRRYWLPFALSEEATTRPRKLRYLGEELIIFRDGKGQVGLLDRAACIAARHSTTAASKRTASAAAITAGCSTFKAIASNNRANRRTAS